MAVLVAGSVLAKDAATTYRSAMDLLAEGRQKDAEELVGEACATYPEDQRLLFLRGEPVNSALNKGMTGAF